MNKVPHLLVSCSDNPPKADGTASSFTNNQEPTEFKIGSNQYKNRTSPPLWTQLETDIPNPSAIRESRFISLNENSQHPKLEPEPAKQPNPKLVDLNHGGLWSSNSEISKRRYGNLRPEGNIQPIPSTFFSSSILRINFWIFETPGFRHPFAASFQSQLLLSWSTSLWKSHGSDLLWSE